VDTSGATQTWGSEDGAIVVAISSAGTEICIEDVAIVAGDCADGVARAV
jgi:hypothetical protein